MFYIYGLHLEGDKEIRYVGSTDDPTYRVWVHLNSDLGKNTPRWKWVEANRSAVRMTILETVEEDPRGAEKKMIAKLRQEGNRLLNVRRPRAIWPSEQDFVNAPGDAIHIELK